MTDYAKFLVKRLGHGVLVVWAALTIIFGLRFLAPGSPVNAIVPPEVGPEIRQEIINDLGLDKPMHVQYFEYLQRLIIQQDLGYSYVSQTPVWDLIAGRIGATVELGVAAIAIAVVLSIPFGVISALRRHEPVDYAATVFSLLGISTPNFWLALMMVLLLSVHYNVFPTSGRPIGFGLAIEMLVMEFRVDGLISWLAHITLPAVTLGTYFTALITRLTRSEMLEELGEAYVQVLEAKGLPETLITFKHVLRNSLIPVVTVVGLQLGHLINGSVVTEVVFDWPGMGTLLITAINQRDWTLIQGTLVFIAVGWVVLNIAVDLLYTYIDPKVEVE
jgi:peptide/nickel transport system permease protein